MTVRTVRRFVLQPLFLLLAATAPAAAQGGAPNAVLAAQLRVAGLPPATLRLPTTVSQDGTISLALDAVPLETALLEIARKADLELTYSRESLVPGKRVSVHAASIEVDEAFARVLRGTGLEALRSGSGRVIIAPRAFEPPAPVFPEPILRVVGTVRTTPEIATLARYAEPGIIRGHVVEAGSLRPLSGVQVFIPQTALGAVTDAAGGYAIPNVPAGTHAVRATLLGYVDASTSVTVPSGEPAVADFTLSPAAVQLNALVVTGTPGATTRRQLGNAVTTVDAAQITRKMPVSNVQQLLQAQAPGVTVSNSAGIPGTAGTIRIRGQSSLSAGTEPVIYIDGVRVASGAAGSFRNDWQQSGPKAPSMTGPGGPAFGAGQEASALSMINPEDIQSIEIIKGPAAATLYGADAANGVIQIITKKGRRGTQPLQWTAKAEVGQTDWSLDRGTSFTRCTAGRIAETNPNTGAPIFPGCQGTSEGALLTASPLSLPGVLRSGDVRNYALGVRGGGDQYSFYANVSHDLEQGVNLNSEFGRSSARANFTFNPMDQLDFQVNFNYVHDRTSMPNGNNAGTIIQNALIWVPGAAGLSRNQLNDTFRDQEEQFSIYENWLRGDHAIFGTTVNYRPATWFVNRFTVGADVASREAQRWIAPGSAYSPTTGQLTQGSPKNTIYTVDYAGTISNDLSSTLTSALSFGAQYNYSKYQNSVAQGSDFPSSTTKDIAFSTFQTGWTELSEVKKLGFYGQEQIGWNDRLFLTGALRVDNSSVFGSDIKQIYYPKVSASYVISEEPFFRNYSWIDQLRLRAAWGQAGNSPGPFAAIQTYTFTQTTDPTTGVKGLALVRNTKGNPDVKPERGSEIEAGFDLGVLGGRLGGEFTYYDKTTSDALVSVALPPSQGWAVPSYLANLGTIKNSGVEMSVNATPVQSRILTWDARVGFSTNSNELAGFGLPDTTRLQQPFGLTALVQRNVVGYPLGGYWVRDPVLTDGGDPTQPGDYVGGPMRYLGPSMPTRQGSLSSTFTILGNVTLYALFDYQGGNYLYNHSRYATCQARVCEAVNDADVPEAEKAKLLAGIQTNTALYTEKADFVKFRNLSLTYTLPRGFSERFGSDRASITLAGQNLGFLYKPYTGFDPETNFIGINDPGAQWAGVRVDYWNQPMLRRITASLDVTF